MEPACFGEYPYPEIDVSSWALNGAKSRAARIIASVGPDEKKQIQHVYNLFRKFEIIKKEETSFEEFETGDAEIILTAFGSMARNIKAAMKELRKKGVKVGYFRPITLSPFPNERIAQLASEGKDFLVVEMNMGQMFKDIKYAVDGKSNVELLNRPCGEWLNVEEIISAVEKVLERKKYHATSI